MPRFFFDIRNDIDADDYEGVDLPDIEAARAEAILGVRSLACAQISEHGRLVLHHGVEVRNEAGESVLVVRFGDAIAIED